MFKKILNFILKNQTYISPESKSLDGQIVILSGNSGSIGRSITQVLERSGAIIVGTSTNDINKKTDITNEMSVKTLVEETFKRYGRIDVLVNNAGLFSYGAVENISLDEYEKVTDVNVKGVFLLSKHVAKVMKIQKKGTIINIGSKISKNSKVEPNKTLYALTKYAVEGFSFALNRELKPFGIRVVCLMPGTVNTFISRKYSEYMSTYDVAEIIKFILNMDTIDFESIVFKSLKQNI